MTVDKRITIEKLWKLSGVFSLMQSLDTQMSMQCGFSKCSYFNEILIHFSFEDFLVWKLNWKIKNIPI